MDMLNAEAIPITAEMLSLVSEIDEFKGAWRALGRLAPDRLHQLRKVATIESVGSSTRIEGVTLSDREIEALLGRVQTESFTTRDEQEVAGYAAAMETIFDHFEDIPITENHIKQLHTTLLKYSDKDEWHRGQYKNHENRVEAFDENGKSLGIIFETASPFETPGAMQELIDWYKQNTGDTTTHPLIAVAVFIVVFLAIHPFQDGNGRLSRALTTLLLLKAGYAYVPYSSLESIIEENKDGYYLALRRTQGTLKNNTPEWNPWVVFFLRAMQKQKQKLETKVERENILRAAMPELATRILELITQHGELSTGDLMQLTDAPRSTVKNHLGDLVDRGHIKLVGKGRGARYIPA